MMDWLQGMTNAIDYIEEHLLEPVGYDAISRTAGVSTFHFMRLFNILTGFTVGEYIRNRRLTLAGRELSLSDAKVLDVALKYGYETHESFTKAFRQFHGITPSAARKQQAPLKSIGRLSIQVILKGDRVLNYRLLEKSSFTVVGKKKSVTNQNGENFKIVPAFWSQCGKDGTMATLDKLGLDEMGIMGICANFREDSFDYLIAATHSGGPVPDGLETLEIPALTWAVFEAVGPIPDAIQDVWKRIFSEWFPTSEYEHADGPELEVYEMGDMSKPDYKSFIWIPVRKTSCTGGSSR